MSGLIEIGRDLFQVPKKVKLHVGCHGDGNRAGPVSKLCEIACRVGFDRIWAGPASSKREVAGLGRNWA